MFAALTLALISLPQAAAVAAERSGTWSKKSHSIKGTWTIDGDTLSLEGFSTKRAPDLKIFLSPKPLAELNNKNATDGALLVAKLKSAKGDQSYTLPDGADLSKFKTVIVHCERYSKLWGGSAL